MGILESISAGLKAFAAYFGWAKARSDLNNTPEMKAAETAKKELKDDDEISEQVRDGSDADCRNDIAP